MLGGNKNDFLIRIHNMVPQLLWGFCNQIITAKGKRNLNGQKKKG